MKEFKKVNKVFIKSNNTASKIFNRYLYALIPFIFLIIIYNLIWGSTNIIISLLISLATSLITSTITQYIINLIKKKKEFTKIFLEDKVLPISIIISLFSLNNSIPIIIIGSIISIIASNIYKTRILSSSLYGILFIIVYNQFINNIDTPLINLSNLSYINTYNNIVTPYGNILEYILGITKYYLSPILSIIAFIYLFHKKSIKYNIIFSYILTFIFIMLFIGLFNDMNIWYLIFQLTTGNILFLLIFTGVEHINTPTTEEGQIIYGIILGLITSILRFIIPELSTVIPFIIGPILLTRLLNKISYKLKYNKVYYYSIVTICIISVIVSTIIINIAI